MADIPYQLYQTTQNGHTEFTVAPATNTPSGYTPATLQDVQAEAINRIQQMQQLLQNPGGTNSQYLSYAQQFAGLDPSKLTPDQISQLTGVQQTDLAKVGLPSGSVLGPVTATNSSGVYSNQAAADYAAKNPTSQTPGTDTTTAVNTFLTNTGQPTITNQPNTAGGTRGTTGTQGTVYRDANNNFFYNGQPITLDQFHQLGINADFVQPGQTVSLSQATLGHEGGVVQVAQQILDGMKQQGLTINPNAQITPQSVAEFMSFAAQNASAFLPYAQKEIAPYYANQLKLASDSLSKSLGYNEQQITQQEQDIQRKYSNDLKNIGINAADNGFALSGQRTLNEQNLATDTQNTIDQNRRSLAFNEGNAVGNFAQTYGSSNLPTINGAPTPRVIAGQSTFDTSGPSSPFYSLSSNVYNGLTGSNQFAEQSAEQQRASQLEGLYAQQNATPRTLAV